MELNTEILQSDLKKKKKLKKKDEWNSGIRKDTVTPQKKTFAMRSAVQDFELQQKQASQKNISCECSKTGKFVRKKSVKNHFIQVTRL